MIEEASKGSKFYAKKQEDQARISQQAKEMKLALDAFTPFELEAARVSADVLIDNLRAGRILNKVKKATIVQNFIASKGDSPLGYGHVLCCCRDERPTRSCGQAHGRRRDGHAQYFQLQGTQ